MAKVNLYQVNKLFSFYLSLSVLTYIYLKIRTFMSVYPQGLYRIVFLQLNLGQTKGLGTGKIILFAITSFRYIEVLFSFAGVKKIQE